MESPNPPRYDILIPAHPKDFKILQPCIESLQRYAAGAGTIWIVSASQPPAAVADSQRLRWIPESVFPFQLSDVRTALGVTNGREGWYFQQLVKLYCFRVLPELREKVLLFDADTVLQRPVEFVSPSGSTVFMDWTEIQHAPYFRHAAAAVGPKWKRPFSVYSGVTDHMVVRKDLMESLLRAVEAHTGQPAWKGLLATVSPTQAPKSGMSEYELYFNWAFTQDRPRHRLRQLRHLVATSPAASTPAPDVDMISYHSWAAAKEN
jgi:hypothetical protein